MNQPKKTNQSKSDSDHINTHWNMVSDYDVISTQMGGVNEGSIVLNLGVRLGVLASYVARVWNAFVISTDTSVRILESVKRRTDETGTRRRTFSLHASADRLPLRGRCVDVVISTSVTHGLLREEILRVFQEFRRVLTNTGRFVLVEDWATETKNKVEGALVELRGMLAKKEGMEEHHLNYREYGKILSEVGFEIEEIRFLPRRISLERFKTLEEEGAIELLQILNEMDPRQLQIDLTLISSRVKR